MLSNHEEELLAKLHSLPSPVMDGQAKREILSVLKNVGEQQKRRGESRKRLVFAGKSVAAGALLLATVWGGSHMFLSNSAENAADPTTPPLKEEPSLAAQADASTRLLQSVKQLAKVGMVMNSDFALARTTSDTIEEKLGKPEESFYASGLSYASYQTKSGLVFAYNKGAQLTEIRSFDPRLKQVSLSAVMQTYGEPESINRFAYQVIYSYPINGDTRLQVVVPDKLNQKDPSIDHIRILYRPGLQNLMANSNHQELLAMVMEQAKEGKVIGSNFVAGKTTADTVKKE